MAGKPGNPNWVKGGPSPNPGGRPKAALELKRRLEDIALDDDTAALALRELMKSADERIRLDAIKFVVDHVKGKAPQAITGPDGGAVQVNAVDERQRLEELRARYPELLSIPGHDEDEGA